MSLSKAWAWLFGPYKGIDYSRAEWCIWALYDLFSNPNNIMHLEKWYKGWHRK